MICHVTFCNSRTKNESLIYLVGNHFGMWSILGKEAIYIDVPNVFVERMSELAGEGEKADSFRACLEKSETRFMINNETGVCSFMVYVPDTMGPEDIQNIAETALAVAQAYEAPLLTADGTEQRYKIIITNNQEPELLGLNKTEGFSSGQVFMPIFRSLASPGRMNPKFED
ncbi:MAG: hypothetical protein PWR17_1067 [Candidatus Methanomethylophilaceae archaeon]|nr:hypothetical protein [Candidatus Methanomethylophilaceae archaeon]